MKQLTKLQHLKENLNFKCKFNIDKYTEIEKEFTQMFDFQHSHLTQEQIVRVVTIIVK